VLGLWDLRAEREIPAPPPLSLARSAERLSARQDDVFFVQIGAMDGERFDPLHPLVTRHGWRGLLVEPLPDLFAALRDTYRGRPGLAFENAAIAEAEGERAMFRVPMPVVEAGDAPEWAVGLGSLYRDRNALGRPALAPHVVEERVRCLTLDGLLERHAVDRIDVLQIDAGGADFMILGQLDWRRHRPAVVHLEVCNLPPGEQQACAALLAAQGYRLAPGDGSGDLLAVEEALA